MNLSNSMLKPITGLECCCHEKLWGYRNLFPLACLLPSWQAKLLTRKFGLSSAPCQAGSPFSCLTNDRTQLNTEVSSRNIRLSLPTQLNLSQSLQRDKSSLASLS